jgi:hypothetical protein
MAYGRPGRVPRFAGRTPAPRPRRRTTVALGALGALGGVAAVVLAVASMTGARTAPPLVFGTYPRGGVGTVGPKLAPRPEDPALPLAALQRLKPRGRPFVVRLYTAYDGRPAVEALDADLLGQIGRYGTAGFRIELVLTHRPQGLTAAQDYQPFSGAAPDVSHLRQLARTNA